MYYVYKQETEMVLTTHVGSLPRTQDVVDFIFARENEQPYDEKSFDACNAFQY